MNAEKATMTTDDFTDDTFATTAANDSVAPPTDMATLEKENADLKDKLLRALAEAENTRRRATKEREDTVKYAVAEFARSLLTVADNFNRAIEAATPTLRADNAPLQTAMQGVEAIERELQQVFELSGMKRFAPIDQMFDPNLHEVMFEVENTGKPAGTIIQTLQAGYMLHDRLLRPARVSVAKGAVEDRKVDTMV